MRYRTILKDVKLKNNKSTTSHCESSSINNVLNYLGYKNINESIIAGGGACLGFSYFRTGFHYPYFHARCWNLKEVFFNGSGIKWNSIKMKRVDWKFLISLLSKKIPVLLRVDIRFLPYLYNGNIGPQTASFGWHIIALFGIDLKKKCAYVSDIHKKTLQEISLKELNRAIKSKTNFFPTNKEIYWIEKPNENFFLNKSTLFLNSINYIISNLKNFHLNNEGKNPIVEGIEGIKVLANDIINIEKHYNRPSELSLIFNIFYSHIENNGTGKSAFRLFYRDFVEEIYRQYMIMELEEIIDILNYDIILWSKLSNLFKKISECIALLKESAKRNSMYTECNMILLDIYDCEKKLVMYLEKNQEVLRIKLTTAQLESS